jgi:hypothetical protein
MLEALRRKGPKGDGDDASNLDATEGKLAQSYPAKERENPR